MEELKFRDPDFDALKRNLKKDIEAMKKFEKFIEKSSKVSPETWRKEFVI